LAGLSAAISVTQVAELLFAIGTDISRSQLIFAYLRIVNDPNALCGLAAATVMGCAERLCRSFFE
jgi:hypothetical protein